MKKLIKITGVFIAAALTMTTTVFAWNVEKQDLSEIEVTFDASIDPGEQTDISVPSDWAVSEVKQARKYGIVPAFSDHPRYTDSITREQFAELAIRVAAVAANTYPDATDTVTFSDCDNINVLAAAAIGIVNGVGDGKFDPKTTTNREQIAAMVARTIDYLEGVLDIDLTPNAPDIAGFADKGDVSDWAADSVGILAANGIMMGTSATELSPKSPCTVEQSIVLMERVYESIINLNR